MELNRITKKGYTNCQECFAVLNSLQSKKTGLCAWCREEEMHILEEMPQEKQ